VIGDICSCTGPEASSVTRTTKGVNHNNSCFLLMGIKQQKLITLNNSKPVCVH
jgi:hypothetical protein